MALAAGAVLVLATWLLLARPSEHPVLRPTPTPSPTGALTTAGVTIKVPFAWHVVSPGDVRTLRFIDRPDQNTEALQPILELSNFDPSRGHGPQCPGRVAPIPPDGVMLYLEAVVGFGAGLSLPSLWPPELDTTPTIPLVPDPCEGGRTVSWIASGTVYQATISIGPSATPSDRAALATSFRSMAFQGITTGGNLSPTFTIGQVRLNGASLAVGAFRSPTGSACVQGPLGIPSCDLVPRPGTSLVVGGAATGMADEHGRFATFVAGTVGANVTSVRVFTGGGRWVSATIANPPPQLAFPFRFFYVEAEVGFQILNRPQPVLALDGSGREIGRGSFIVQGG